MNYLVKTLRDNEQVYLSKIFFKSNEEEMKGKYLFRDIEFNGVINSPDCGVYYLLYVQYDILN